MNLIHQSIGAFLLVVALLSHQPCLATNEQQAPNFQEATSVVPDDFEDVLYQDAQIWIALHWDWRDTGVVTQEMLDFRFTYEEHLPKGWTPFATAYDLFEKLYYHRLQLNPDLGPTYGLDQLLVDDPSVTASFRHFTLTGELATKLTDDPVVLKHVLALLETGDEQEIGLFVSDPEQLVRTSDGTEYFVTTTVEETEEELPGLDPDSGNDEDGDGLIEPLPCDEYPEACDFRRELQRLYTESRLWKAKYKKDGMFFGPGFDCDDFAEAFWAWLKHKQDAGEFPADAESDALWLYWRFTWGNGKGGKHGKAGHAVLVIHHNGYYYIVDAQTGEVYGPFPDTVPYKDIDWHECFQDDFPSRNPDIIKEKHPTDRPWTDPSPWHEDSDRKDDIEDQTDNPAEDYIYPEESAN